MDSRRQRLHAIDGLRLISGGFVGSVAVVGGFMRWTVFGGGFIPWTAFRGGFVRWIVIVGGFMRLDGLRRRLHRRLCWMDSRVDPLMKRAMGILGPLTLKGDPGTKRLQWRLQRQHHCDDVSSVLFRLMSCLELGWLAVGAAGHLRARQGLMWLVGWLRCFVG